MIFRRETKILSKWLSLLMAGCVLPVIIEDLHIAVIILDIFVSFFIGAFFAVDHGGTREQGIIEAVKIASEDLSGQELVEFYENGVQLFDSHGNKQFMAVDHVLNELSRRANDIAKLKNNNSTSP